MLLIPLGIFGLSWQQKVRPKLKPFPVACSCRATFDRYGEDGLKGNVRRHSASDHAFNNSNHFTGFPTGRNIWKQFFKIFRSGTDVGIRDRYIVSSIFLKFLHALTMSFLLLNFDQKYKFSNKNNVVSTWRNFKNIFPRPLFIIIFRPEMLKFHPYSILTGDTRAQSWICHILCVKLRLEA